MSLPALTPASCRPEGLLSPRVLNLSPDIQIGLFENVASRTEKSSRRHPLGESQLASAQPEVLVAPHAEIQVGHNPATRPTKPMTAVAAVHFAAFRFSSLTLFDCS